MTGTRGTEQGLGLGIETEHRDRDKDRDSNRAYRGMYANRGPPLPASTSHVT